jgi:hypothetical protein
MDLTSTSPQFSVAITPTTVSPHDMLASHQRRRFPIILRAIQSAEEEVQTYTSIARNAVSGQAFHSNTTAYPSQVEITPNRYSSKRVKGMDGSNFNATKSGTLSGQETSCYGYGGPHAWMRNKVITCPHKDRAGIREAAAKNYKEWLAKFKACRKKCKGIDYNCLSNANKEKIKKQVLSSIASFSMKDVAATTITDNQSKASNASIPRPQTPNLLIFVVDVSVLLTATANKELLLAPIMTNFPHIRLKLGTDLDNESCPEIRTIFCTAAALSTGNFHFVLAIAKKFPHCLAKLYVPEDYNPIILLGIVQLGSECITTKLTVGYQSHLPYLTRSGQPTSILIATGPHVTVNLIVGLPFIQATDIILDMTDHIAELKTLDAQPFPIEYHRATVHVPIVIVDKSKIGVSIADYEPVVKLIENLEHHFTAAIHPQPFPIHASPKCVSFGSHTIDTFVAAHSDCHSGKHELMDADLAFYHDQLMGSGPDE